MRINTGHRAESPCCGEDRVHNFSGSRKLKSVSLVKKSYRSSVVPDRPALLSDMGRHHQGSQTTGIHVELLWFACVCMYVCLQVCVACVCGGCTIKPMEKPEAKRVAWCARAAPQKQHQERTLLDASSEGMAQPQMAGDRCRWEESMRKPEVNPGHAK